ncbi:MAG: hypothetical protein J6F33_06615 [Acidaminococcaceae bacterium]|nr:hypothetical protein [Acidaminococcaceae bacterium]
MAKYLGGIKDQNIEVTGISQHFFDNGFDVEYYDYTRDTIAVRKLDIKKYIVQYEEITAEKLAAPDHRMTGALAGFNAGGLLGGVLGAVLAGSTSGEERHVLLCELNNGWNFALELNKNEFMAWESSMGAASK